MPATATTAKNLSPLNAFPGPRAFKPDEGNFFCGRDREAAQLTDLLFTYQDVLLYAQSGAGKTSLINARLLAKLGATNCYLGRVGGGLPRGVAVDKINIFKFNLTRSIAIVDDAGKFVPAGVKDLEEYFQPDPAQEHMFLIIDQLEEVFTNYPELWEHRRPFFEQLRSLLKLNPNLHLLLAIREEHLAALEFYDDLFPNQLRIRYHLQSLRSEQAAEAIRDPLKKCGLAIKEGLVEKIVNSLRSVPVKTSAAVIEIPGEFVEPLHLQVVARNLVTRLPAGTKEVTEKQVAAFGDVDEALREFYENAIAATANEAKITETKIRRWFSDQLITAAGTRGIVFQGAEKTAGLPNRAVDVLEKESVIRKETRAGAAWFELTHDRFIKPIQISNNQHFAEQQKKRSRVIYSSIALLIYCVTLAVFYLNKREQSQTDALNDQHTQSITDANALDLQRRFVSLSLGLRLPRSMYRKASADSRAASEIAIIAVALYDLGKNGAGDEQMRQALANGPPEGLLARDLMAAIATLDEGMKESQRNSDLTKFLPAFKTARYHLLKMVGNGFKNNTSLKDYLCTHNVRVVASFPSSASADKARGRVMGRFPLADVELPEQGGPITLQVDAFLSRDDADSVIAESEKMLATPASDDDDLPKLHIKPFSDCWYKDCPACSSQGR